VFSVTLYLFYIQLSSLFYVRQDIKTAARDFVLHGIVSQSNRPSIINGVRFYDCCSKEASNDPFTMKNTDDNKNQNSFESGNSKGSIY
jgi:hypothetical protein